MKIKLDPSEMMFAVMGGAMRRIQALQRGRVDKYGTVQYPWQADIEGAMAEMAVAKAFGIFGQATLATFMRLTLALIKSDPRHTKAGIWL